MSVIVINGKSYRYNGTLSFVNGDILVNGKKVENWEELEKDQKHINIQIEGNVERLQVESCDTVHITGSCSKVKTVSGDIEIGGDVWKSRARLTPEGKRC